MRTKPEPVYKTAEQLQREGACCVSYDNCVYTIAGFDLTKDTISIVRKFTEWISPGTFYISNYKYSTYSDPGTFKSFKVGE